MPYKVIVIQGKCGAGKTQVMLLMAQLAKGKHIHLIDDPPFANDAAKMVNTIMEAKETGHVIVTRRLGKSGGHRGTAYLDQIADAVFTVGGIKKLR